jgi:hypothetical protein
MKMWIYDTIVHRHGITSDYYPTVQKKRQSNETSSAIMFEIEDFRISLCNRSFCYPLDSECPNRFFDLDLLSDQRLVDSYWNIVHCGDFTVNQYLGTMIFQSRL